MGARVYAAKCASCHGGIGEGTSDNHPEPLCGDKPTIDLAEAISATMPEGEPEKCVGDEAAAVAEWMQSAFYSPEAQARLHPPQPKLSRLTDSQYRNAVADLMDSFRWTAQPGNEPGLKARYYKSRSFRDKDKAIERTDPIVDFQFGEGTPDKEKIPDAQEFSIRWEGSVIIDETGWYDFILKTENGGKLYVNDTREPLIDAWVKSGYDTEYRASRFLIAGRLYPIRLEWFTYKEKTASVGLWWKAPGMIDRPIPARRLTTQSSPTALIVETPFPPDDRSDGYIRGTSISQEWDEATTFAAVEVADNIGGFLRDVAGLKREDNDAARADKLKSFCETLAYRAFRRPLTDAERQAYVGRNFATAADTEEAVRLSVISILKSPRFLYRELTQEEDLYTRAERLSFALIDSVPDRNLLEAAEKGWLSSDKGLRDQAWRLVNSYRGRVQLQEFLRVWINIERLHDISKDKEAFPDFTPELAADLRESLELMLTDAVTGDGDEFQQLLTSPDVWVNSRMASYYGVEAVDATELSFRKVSFQPDHRSGLLSHPFMLAGLAYQKSSSPIHRGVFLSRGVLGRALTAPPDSIAPVPPELAPDLTTRERVALQTSPEMCNNCHHMINSLGFALEEFD
ncbi:MAG: DUF1592 domain-containing protein, partial [Planctomycetaceae bacterium]|nr:DUF1592 domain-containing protein [Planctomycetaceae bacterium]